MPVRVAFVEVLHDLNLQAVAHRRDPLALGRHFLLTELASLPEPHDEGNGQGAGPHPALVAAPVDLRHQAHPRAFFPHVQGPDAFRSVDLVGGEGHQVNLERFDVHRDLADGLRGVAVEEDAFLLGDLPDLGDGVDHANLVVGHHDRNQDGLVRNGFPDIVGTDEAILSDRQVRDFDAALLQGLAGVYLDLFPAPNGPDVGAPSSGIAQYNFEINQPTREN